MTLAAQSYRGVYAVLVGLRMHFADPNLPRTSARYGGGGARDVSREKALLEKLFPLESGCLFDDCLLAENTMNLLACHNKETVQVLDATLHPDFHLLHTGAQSRVKQVIPLVLLLSLI